MPSLHRVLIEHTVTYTHTHTLDLCSAVQVCWVGCEDGQEGVDRGCHFSHIGSGVEERVSGGVGASEGG